MNRKIVILLMLGFSLAVSCQTKTEHAYKGEKMQNLDSLLTTYTHKPVYYAQYGNRGCLFELRINGVLIDKLSRRGTIGETATTINPNILKSGKQKVSVRLFPFPDEELIANENPFRLEIGWNDFAIETTQDEERPWNVVFTLPPVEMPAQGLPYIELEGEFEAQVPYHINGWSDCIDLRELPDIEQRVVDEYKRIRQLMVDRKFDELKQYFAYSDNELSVSLYESTNDYEAKWKKYCENIGKGIEKDFQPIEDYEMIFSDEGRSVALRSKKKKGITSALVWIKEDKETDSWTGQYFELHLGIKKGTDTLIAIIG